MMKTKMQVLVVLAAGVLLGYLAASSNLRFDRQSIASPANLQPVNAQPADSFVPSASALALKADGQKTLLLAQADNSGAASGSSGKKPNIVFIMADDIGWFNVGAYHRGIMSGRTPNLDKLASQGMLFTDYYAEASCTAGRANFITGELPIRTGLTTVGQAGATLGMPAEAPTIATALKSMGYATGQFGKNHLGDLNKFLPTVHGFDEFWG
ncbi:MAG TPA: sulfatase-like hydrolase/transferase, partial [Pirellulales bacterium]